MSGVNLPVPFLPTAQLPISQQTISTLPPKDIKRYIQVEMLNPLGVNEIYMVSKENATQLDTIHCAMSQFYAPRIEALTVLPCHLTTNANIVVNIGHKIIRRAVIDQPQVDDNRKCARVFLPDTGEVHVVDHQNILYQMKTYAFPGCAFVVKWNHAHNYSHPDTGHEFNANMINLLLEEQSSCESMHIFVVNVEEKDNCVIIEDILFKHPNVNTFFSEIVQELGFDKITDNNTVTHSSSVNLNESNQGAFATNDEQNECASEDLIDFEHDLEQEFTQHQNTKRTREEIDLTLAMNVTDLRSVIEANPNIHNRLPHILEALDLMRQKFDRVLVLEQNPTDLDKIQNVKNQVNCIRSLATHNSFPELFEWAKQD